MSRNKANLSKYPQTAVSGSVTMSVTTFIKSIYAFVSGLHPIVSFLSEIQLVRTTFPVLHFYPVVHFYPTCQSLQTDIMPEYNALHDTTELTDVITKTLTRTALATPSVVSVFADAGSSIMSAAAAAPSPQQSIVYQTVHVNPFQHANAKLFEYLDLLQEFSYQTKEYILRKLYENLPTFLIRWTCSSTTFAIKAGTLVAAVCLLGVAAYETSFNTFKFLGYLSPSNDALFRKHASVLREEIKALPSEVDKSNAEKQLTRKEKLNKEIERGGSWVWAAAGGWLVGRLFLSPKPWFAKLAWGFLEALALFCVVPILAACVVRVVVPRAYMSEGWLCEREGGVPLYVGEDGKYVAEKREAKVKFEDETPRGEYHNELKRVGAGHRAARRAAKGGIDSSRFED